MKNVILGSLALALGFTTLLPAQADTVLNTTGDYRPAPSSETHVVESWMQPTVSRTRNTTNSNGDTETVVEPLVMERHERVVVPTTETTTTTVVGPEQRVTTEETSRVQTRSIDKASAAKHVRRVALQPRRHFVAHRYTHSKKAIAYRPTVRRDDYVVRRTTTVEPQVIQQNQKIEQKSVIIERRDPALDLY